MAWLGLFVCACVPASGQRPGESLSDGRDSELPSGAVAEYADGEDWEPVVPLSPGGVIPRDMNARQWDQFVAQAGIQADGKVKTFTPTWTGFSADPVGDISYLDFGAIVIMWSAAELTGTSSLVT